MVQRRSVGRLPGLAVAGWLTAGTVTALALPVSAEPLRPVPGSGASASLPASSSESVKAATTLSVPAAEATDTVSKTDPLAEAVSTSSRRSEVASAVGTRSSGSSAEDLEPRTGAARVAEELDAWIRRVAARLQQAAALGTKGFDKRQPGLSGPSGEGLSMSLHVKVDGKWRAHPGHAGGLEDFALEEALAGTTALPLQDGLLVAAAGSRTSVVTVLVPWAELAATFSRSELGRQAVLFDRKGEARLHGERLSSDQTAVFRGLLPSAQTEVKVTGRRFVVASAPELAMYVVVPAEVSSVATGEVLALPEPAVLERPAGLDLPGVIRERSVIAGPLAIGLVAGAWLFIQGRRRQRKVRRKRQGRPQVPDLGAVDYLDALARDTEDPLAGLTSPEVPLDRDPTLALIPEGSDPPASPVASAPEVDLADLVLSAPPPVRTVPEELRARARGEEVPVEVNPRKGVRPEDVLVTRGDLDRILDKGLDRLFQRMLASVEDLERKTHEAVQAQREGFKELLGRFHDLQETRERDLAEHHARMGRFDQDLAAVELRWRGTDAKAAEADLRLREQAEGLLRRMGGQEGAMEALGARIEGLGQALRQTTEHGRAEFDLLRGELGEVRKALDEARRQLRAELGDEAAQRRQGMEDVRDEDRAARREVERQVQQVATRLEEVATQVSGRIEQLGRDLDGTGQQILQAEIHQRESLRQVHERLVPQGQMGQLRQEVSDLKALLVQRDREVEDLRLRFDQMVRDQRDDRQQLLQQLQRELGHVHQATPLLEQQQIQFITLQQENQRLAQRVQQVLQLMQSLNQTVHQAETRTLQEIDWLKSQVRSTPDPRYVPIAAPVPAAAPVPVAEPVLTPPPSPPSPPAGDDRPIDLWGRLMGRDRESVEDTLRRRRPGG